MSGEASGFSGDPKGRSQRSPSYKPKSGDKKASSKSKNAAKSSAAKPTPSWLSSSSASGTDPQGLDFDLSDPEDLLRKLETMDLTDEETDELLKRALEINKQLKQMESPAFRTGGSAPQPGPGTGTGRPRSRGSSGMTSEGDLLPELSSRGGRHTSLSSGMYSRAAASSPASSQGSARYTSYQGAQVAYADPRPHPPARQKPRSGRHVVYE